MTATKTCLITSCHGPASRREMCEKHYKAWRRRQPKCQAEGCESMLLPDERESRSDYCRPHEQLALTRRTLSAQAKTLARFRRAVEADWHYGCWIWQEQPNNHGYGMIHAGTPWLAHRFAYVWFYGGHARRKTLDHICNRTLCVRPDHLQVVSKTINTSLRDKRTFASVGTRMDLGHIPTSDAADAWASAEGLPTGNPLWWDRSSHPSQPPC